jgi:hypothetical protein
MDNRYTRAWPKLFAILVATEAARLLGLISIFGAFWISACVAMWSIWLRNPKA